MVDKHYCGVLVCLMWQVIMLVVVGFMRTVVDKRYCGGLLCLLKWVIMLVVVVFLAYFGG